MIRVLIADDHAVVREGLRAFLALQDDIEVVGEAADGEEAVQAVVRLEPDVVLVDLVMPRVDGIEAIGRIRAGAPDARHRPHELRRRGQVLPAVRAGAAGYLLKDVEPQELVSAIRTVARRRDAAAPDGGRRLGARGSRDGEPPRRPSRSPRASARCSPSSPAAGRTSAIARELGVSEKTVKTHVSNILGKLGVADRTQAALYAVREGSWTPSPSAPVLGPIPDTARAAGVPSASWHPPPSSPAPRAASASRSPARSPRALAPGHRRPRRRRARGGPPRAGRADDVDRAGRRRRRPVPPPRARPAAGDRIDVLVNNASILGPSPQPALRRLPARRARATSTRSTRSPRSRSSSSRCPPARRRADRQRHLRRRRRGLRGLGRLRLVEGRARAADPDPRRRAPEPRASTPSTPATCAPRCTRRRSRARTSPTARRPRTACPGCSP